MSAAVQASPVAQVAAARRPVIEFNGLRYAQAPRRSVANLQHLDPRPGFDGWFKAGVGGVLLMRPDGEPFAFASSNDCGFLVTAHLWQGRARYQFGLAEHTQKTLGVTGRAHEHELARSILDQAGVTLRHLSGRH